MSTGMEVVYLDILSLFLGSTNIVKAAAALPCDDDRCKTGSCNSTGHCICNLPDPSTILDGDRPFQGVMVSHVQNGDSSLDTGHTRLHELGYKQELKRDLSVVSNFTFSFSILSVLTGITTLYNTGFNYGGPVVLVYGWLIAGVFTMIVGLSMAEICSSYPTSGGLYYWSSKLAGPSWTPFASWLTGWFNIVGQWAVTSSIDFSLAQLIHVIILLSTGEKNGGGYGF